MARLAIAVLLLLTGCAHPVAPLATPAATTLATPAPASPAPLDSFYLPNTLPAETEICLTRETFRNMGLVCISVGELRALLRSRLDVTARGVDR